MARRWSEDDILEALRAIAGKVDGPLRWDEYDRLRVPGIQPAPATITGRYGSWAAALEAAGLPLPTYAQRRRWTREEALEVLRAWLSRTESATWERLERDRRAGADLPPPHVIRWHFTGWKGAVKAARSA